MIQFFKIDKSKIHKSEFSLINDKQAYKFFLKRFLYLIIIIYSTLFLAAAIPFVSTPFVPIYFAGSFTAAIFSIRLINHFFKYKRFKNGKISLNENEIIITGASETVNISADSITYIELNIPGNLVIKEKERSTSFPYSLLEEKDREALLSNFVDMAPKRTALYKKVWEFIDAVAVALILAVHIIQYIVQAYFIPTGSMMDTLRIGDHLFVEKITYGPIIPKMIGMEKPLHLSWLGIRGIKRGDIVIFRPPHEKDKDYIKRCIAVPGDKIEIKHGYVYINGKKIDESSYVKGLTYDDSRTSKIQGIVPEGKVVVLGDNRENSMDSRYFGYLEIERIKGKAFILYWNTDDIKKLDFSRIGLIK